MITTNRVENVSKIIFNGIETIPHAITNSEINVNIPEYTAKTGKVIIEIEDKNLKAKSKEGFAVEYLANQLAFVGGDTRVGAIGFTIGTKIFLGLESANNDFWEYDIQTYTRKQIADFPGRARTFTASFVIGNKGYIETGQLLDSKHTKDLWEYDPVADQWTQKAEFPGYARDKAVGFSIEGKGYIGAYKDMWQYDPVDTDG
ncbi:MAG TPA: hypothetical protein DCS93_35675 [Microscillaceae bacterium]|nr:hypothetical protein [Microscillaceae bacterium]